ncbi:hypothetical protein LQZ19_00465 [Treponema primitia]|uniref:hypothetical protein n=1 Tax=Treponema primitia TaxID=88058 RepID=UPI00397EF819
MDKIVPHRGKWEDILLDPNKLKEYKFEYEQTRPHYQSSAAVNFSLAGFALLLSPLLFGGIEYIAFPIVFICLAIGAALVTIKLLKWPNVYVVLLRHIKTLTHMPLGYWHSRYASHHFRLYNIWGLCKWALSQEPSQELKYIDNYPCILGVDTLWALIHNLDLKHNDFERQFDINPYLQKGSLVINSDGTQNYTQSGLYTIYEYGYCGYYRYIFFKKIILSNPIILKYLKRVRNSCWRGNTWIRITNFGRAYLSDESKYVRARRIGREYEQTLVKS